MIYFVLARGNSSTIKNYLSKRGKEMEGKIGIIYYENLKPFSNLECNTLIFSDFDRLTSLQLKRASALYNQIKENYPDVTIINNPEKVKKRYDLLRALYKRGINNYNVFRVNDLLTDLQFPVFLREENNHTGALSDLIYNYKNLERNILALNLQGYPSKNLLIVEFVNVASSDGLFKKYSALKIGNQIIPRQLDYNMHWMVKTSFEFNTFPEEEYFKEFEYYIRENPHNEMLKNVFDISEINYGRIDYGMVDEKPIVWEINLNPNYGGLRFKKKNESNERLSNLRADFHQKLRSKLTELENNKNSIIKIQIENSLLKSMKTNGWFEFVRKLHNMLTTKKPLFKKVVKSIRICFLFISKVLLYFLKPFGFTDIKVK